MLHYRSEPCLLAKALKEMNHMMSFREVAYKAAIILSVRHNSTITSTIDPCPQRQRSSLINTDLLRLTSRLRTEVGLTTSADAYEQSRGPQKNASTSRRSGATGLPAITKSSAAETGDEARRNGRRVESKRSVGKKTNQLTRSTHSSPASEQLQLAAENGTKVMTIGRYFNQHLSALCDRFEC